MEPVGYWVLSPRVGPGGFRKKTEKERERGQRKEKANAKVKPLADQFSAEGCWKAGGFALY